MKKYIILLLLPLLFSCSDDDSSGEIRIKESGSLYHRKGDNGKYENSFFATVTNTTEAPVMGYVRFEIKEYGMFNSDTLEVTNKQGFQKTFFLSLETEKPIDKSYLLNAEFVRE